MRIKPITLKASNEYVEKNHRHHNKVVGHKFSISLVDNDDVVRGVVISGRPVARSLDDGLTLEVTRLCTDGVENGCSMLYSAVNRAAKAMGYTRVITYTLEEESGVSLKAAGWKKDSEVKGRSWNCPSRPRTDKHPTVNKIRWIAP